MPVATDTAETMPFDVSLAAAPAEKTQSVARNLEAEFERAAYQNKRKRESEDSKVEDPKPEKSENTEIAVEAVKDVKDETVAGSKNPEIAVEAVPEVKDEKVEGDEATENDKKSVESTEQKEHKTEFSESEARYKPSLTCVESWGFEILVNLLFKN